jgi:uncharacterized protein DUF6709
MWVENEARRANRNLLVTNGLIAAVVLLIAGANYRYCANFFLGCQPISAIELASLSSPDQRWRNFVTVTGDKQARTGYRDVERRVEKATGRVISTEVKDEYVLLRAGGKILLVKAPPGEARLEYSGELVPTPEQVQADLLRPLAAKEPDVGAMVLPFTLNAADYRSSGWIGLAVMAPLLALALWNVLKAVRRSSEPQSSPVWKMLSAYGNAEQLSQQIEAEMQPAALRKYGNLLIGPQWMVRRSTFRTWVSPVGDLVWVYKKVTKHSVNFIPTGKTYAVILVGRHKQRTEEQMKEQAVNELLMELTRRVPWALFGFDKNLEQAWRKNPQGVIAAVDQRYQQFQNKAAAAPAT